MYDIYMIWVLKKQDLDKQVLAMTEIKRYMDVGIVGNENGIFRRQIRIGRL